MSAPRFTAKKKANEKGRRKRPNAGPGHFSTRTLLDAAGRGLRASSPRGRAARLALRVANAPKSKVSSDLDFKNYTYTRPGAGAYNERTDRWAPVR
jgi:hypothetical protein